MKAKAPVHTDETVRWKPVDLTVSESVEEEDFLAAPELKEAVDAVRADLCDYTKLQDLIIHHWSGGVRQCAKDVLLAAIRIEEAADAIHRQRESEARRVESYIVKSS